VKTVEMVDATGPLSDYARKAQKEPLIVTVKGKPVVALQPLLNGTELENLRVEGHPTFQRILKRSQARYASEGGISTVEMRRRLAARRKTSPKARKTG
jgi:hypothetical protein